MANDELQRAKVEVAFQKQNAARVRNVMKLLNQAKITSGAMLNLSCECSSTGCQEQIAMELTDYQRISHRDNEFMVVAGHQDADIESVIRVGEGYVVIAKRKDLWLRIKGMMETD